MEPVDSPANVDVSRSRSRNSEPYPYAYHYTDHFLTNVEFNDGSQSAATSLPKFRAEPKDNAGQVFDTSPQSATHTSQGVWSAYIPPSAMCMDQLREELSCAICLEICFEPCTTPCGHSFCKKCLTSAADRCGNRCPKCRQQLLISNQRGTAVSTVLWNTIQLLFPKEVEARKAAGELSRAEPEHPQRMNSPFSVVDSRTWSRTWSEDEDSDYEYLNSLFSES